MVTIESLFEKIETSKQVDLSEGSLGEAGTTLIPFLRLIGGDLVVSTTQGPSWIHPKERQKFNVSGIASRSVLGIGSPEISVTVWTNGKSLDYVIEFETPSEWNFGQAYDSLIGTEFERIAYNTEKKRPKFTLATNAVPEGGIQTGLRFEATLEVNEIFSAILELVPEAQKTVTVEGTITSSDLATNVTIEGKIETSEPPSLELPGFLTFQFGKCDIALSASLAGAAKTPIINRRIESVISLVGKGNSSTVSLPLALQLPTTATGWMLMLQPGETTDLQEFFDFIAMLGSAGQFNLDSAFSAPVGNTDKLRSALRSVTLSSFFVEIDGSLHRSPAFRALTFEARTSGSRWEILKNRLSLSNLRVSLNVRKGETSTSARGLVAGDFDIGNNLTISASIPLPFTEGPWSFASRHPVPLPGINDLSHLTDGTSINSLLPDSFSEINGLTLTELSMVFDPQKAEIKQLSFAIATDHSWRIIPDQFEISSLFVRLSLTKGNNGWGLSGLTQAELMAGGVSIDTQISKTSPESDWLFHLQANRIYLPSISDLGSLTGSESALKDVFPDGLSKAQLYLDEPRLELDISKKKIDSFGFTLATEQVELGEFSIVSAGVDVDLIFGTSKKIHLFGEFSIEGIDFQIEGTTDGQEGWELLGSAARQKSIPIGDVFQKLGRQFDFEKQVPGSLKGLLVSNIAIQFNTKSKEFLFSLETRFPLDNRELDALISVHLTSVNGKYSRKLSGIVKVGDLEFDLLFNQEQGADTVFLAAYRNASGKDENIRALAELITDSPEILSAAEGISFQLKNALLVVEKGTATKLLFGLDIGGGLDISNLPLVGKLFPAGANVRLAFQPLLTNQDFSSDELSRVRSMVPPGGYQLPTEAKERLGFNMQLIIGDQTIDLSLPIGVDSVKSQEAPAKVPTTTTNSSSNEASPPPPSTAGGVKWISIQKQLGPINFRRVGIQYKDSQLNILLDAALSAAGLTISLEGLYARSKINPIEPHFGLHGLGIDYANGPLEIGGAFLRQTVTDPDGYTYDTFDGTAIIRSEKFALAALGSYAYYRGHPSMFVYAILDSPLGGPSFFFVTGLAAGFGYNRRLVMPGIDKVKDFPLVAEAVAGVPGKPDDLGGEIAKLHDVIPPATGQNFLAVGVRFSSFEIIDSFVLLSVSFGQDFEVDVLGLSTLVIPTPEEGNAVEPLAVVQMALKAAFNPGKGFLKVRAELTSESFILSRDCHLTGGFAFYTWFKDDPLEKASAGDFVLTLGGYHPRFRPPSHYPQVSPLGFNWKVGNSGLVVKGDFYFALVPSAVMAGGHLDATYQSGNLRAWFKLGADFIISWKPYFYDASMSIEVGASYTYHFFGTHHLSVSLGAGLHIWGPEFSGVATLDLWVTSIDVTFGAGSSQSPPPLDWAGFREAFLPAASKWANLSVTGGLVKQLGEKENPLFVMDPKNFALETNTPIPITSSPHLGDSNKTINVGPMKITDGIDSRHDIRIFLGTLDVTKDFGFSPVKKNAPGALWGNKFRHEENEGEEDRLVKDACMGFSITGKPIMPADESHSVSREKLLNENEDFLEPIRIPAGTASPNIWMKSAGARDAVTSQLEARTTERDALLGSLGFTERYRPKAIIEEGLIIGS